MGAGYRAQSKRGRRIGSDRRDTLGWRKATIVGASGRRMKSRDVIARERTYSGIRCCWEGDRDSRDGQDHKDDPRRDADGSVELAMKQPAARIPFDTIGTAPTTAARPPIYEAGESQRGHAQAEPADDSAASTLADHHI